MPQPLTPTWTPRHIDVRMPHGIYSRRFRHGLTWYIRYTVGGRIVREKIGAERDGFTRSHAKTALQSRLGDLAQGKFRLPKVRRPIRSGRSSLATGNTPRRTTAAIRRAATHWDSSRPNSATSPSPTSRGFGSTSGSSPGASWSRPAPSTATSTC